MGEIRPVPREPGGYNRGLPQTRRHIWLLEVGKYWSKEVFYFSNLPKLLPYYIYEDYDLKYSKVSCNRNSRRREWGRLCKNKIGVRSRNT